MLRYAVISIAVISLTGCQSLPKTASPNLVPEESYCMHANASDHTARIEAWFRDRSVFSEEEKIKYLLKTMEASPYRFVRNGSRYDGAFAARWLQWKKGHRQYRDNPIITAQDFVHRVAVRSNQTGQLYWMILPGNRWVSLERILSDELNSLEQAFHTHLFQQAISRLDVTDSAYPEMPAVAVPVHSAS